MNILSNFFQICLQRKKIFETVETPFPKPCPLFSQTYLNTLKLTCILSPLVLHIYFIYIHNQYMLVTYIRFYTKLSFCKFFHSTLCFRGSLIQIHVHLIHYNYCIIFHCVNILQLFIHSPIVGYVGGFQFFVLQSFLK